MTVSNHAIPRSHVTDQRTVYYTQKDVDVIRDQIIQGESMKRRSLILGLILATAGLAGTIALLSSSYAISARTQAKNDQLTQQSAAAAQRSAESQLALDALRARDARLESAKVESQALTQRVLTGMPGSSDAVVLQGGRFAKAIYQQGGRVETTNKPPDKLFRNWKVGGESGSEVYTVVGGFVDGKWVIYSNLVARRQNAESPISIGNQN